MPLFELFRLAKGKLGPPQEKPTSSPAGGSSPIVCKPGNDFAELKLENGQIVLQGQTNLPVYKNIFAPSGISMNQEDDMVPFSHYPISGSLNSSDYIPDSLTQLPGVVVNQSSEGNNLGSVLKFDHGPFCGDSLFGSLQSGNGLEEGTRARTSSGMRLHPPPSSSSLPMESQEPSSNNTSAMVNFPYFSRPIAAPRGKVRSHNKTAALDLLHKESARGTDEDAAAVYVTNTCNTKPIGSPSALGKGQALPRTISAPQKGIAFKAVPDGKSSKQPISVKKSGAVVIQGEDALKEDKQSWQPSRTAKGGPSDGEKTLEPIGVSSSICSGNDVGGACDDMKHIFKRKYHEAEDSEGCSDDVEEELVSAKRQTAGGDIPRRNRVAEVHNLSERRRRDRINEKMHALQELIPSCNKVDKASMLDEAIEYIKTLKLQLQMVTMGTGMCMMPTMPSTRMQNMEHMPHYPYLGMGMIPAMHAMASSMYGLCGPGFTLPMACTPPGPNSASGVPLPVGNQDLTMVSNDKRSVQNTTCLTEKQQNSQDSNQCRVAISIQKVSEKKCKVKFLSAQVTRTTVVQCNILLTAFA